MKTIGVNQQQPLCESQLKSSFWHLRLPQAFHWPLRFNPIHRSALRDTLAGLSVTVNEIVSNYRYTVGVILLLVIAPVSSVFYLVFDSTVSSDWYYLNYFYYFYTLSPYMMMLFASVGIFLLFPVKCKTSYLANIWPVGYSISKLIYLGALVHTNEQFQNNTPFFLLIIGVLSAIGFLLSMDYLLYRRYHLKHGTMARIVGIIKAPGIPAADKMRLLENQSLELENFNQRY